MLITCITHASARSKKYLFRGLTEQGWREVESAADRFKKLAGKDDPRIAVIVASPKARCVETAILFSKAVSEFVSTSEMELEVGLKAGSISGSELFDLSNMKQIRHLLVSAHADIVRALPVRVALIPEAANGGWFSTRPVLFQLQYKVGDPWNSATINYCEGLLEGKWQRIIE